MAEVQYTAQLDFTDNGTFETGWRIKQGDFNDSLIVIRVVNNGFNMYDASITPTIAFRRADGKSVVGEMIPNDGTYKYTIVGNEIAVPGPTLLDVKYVDSEGRISTASCRFQVVEDTIGYDPTGASTYNNPVSELVAQATEDSLIAEGFAVGQQRGQDVPESSPYYHNNAKYYSDLTDPTALRNMSDVDVEGVQNGQVLKWNATTEKWENGTGGGGASSLDDLSDVEIDTPSNGQVLKYNTLDSEWQNMTLISDSTTSGSTVWSSNKTNSELSSKEDAPTILTSTLTSGSTSLTFSNAAITTTAMYDVYADKYGLTPTDITVTTGQAVLTFEAQSANVSVKLVIR